MPGERMGGWQGGIVQVSVGAMACLARSCVRSQGWLTNDTVRFRRTMIGQCWWIPPCIISRRRARHASSSHGQAWEPAPASRITTTPPPGTCNVPLRSKPPRPTTAGGHGGPTLHHTPFSHGQAWEPAPTSRITTTPPPGTCNVPLRSKPPHPAATGGHGGPTLHHTPFSHGQAWEPAPTSRITSTPPPGTCNVPLRSKPPHPATTGGHGSPPVYSDQSPVAGHRRPNTFDAATIIAYNANGLQ